MPQISHLVKTYYIKVNFGNCASLFIKISQIFPHNNVMITKDTNSLTLILPLFYFFIHPSIQGDT